MHGVLSEETAREKDRTVCRIGLEVPSCPAPGSCAEVSGPFQEPVRSDGT